VFFYDISPEFSDGSIEMSYNSRYVTDEDDLSVYGCDDWDSDDKTCNGELEEINFKIDKRNNLIFTRQETILCRGYTNF